MRRLPRSVTTLASVLAVAAPLVVPGSVRAQNRPYAASGSYEQVTDTNVAATNRVGDVTINQGYQDVTETDVTDNHLSPDVQRPAEGPLDLTSQEDAQAATEKQRYAEDQSRARHRQGERFYNDPEQGRRTFVAPYIEAAQLFDAQFSSPNSQTLTYSVLSAGLDAGVRNRNAQGSVSLRVERRFGYGQAESSTNVSGVGHGVIAIVPDTVHFEVAGYANRTHIEGTGATAGNIGFAANNAQITTIMAGPSVATESGDAKIDAHYRIGYSHVGVPSPVAAPPGGTTADIFDHSTVQDAKVRVGTQPGGAGLPVGLAVEAAHYQENISNLDQHARDSHVRGEVTIPIAYDAAVVGGVGYERVQVSNRDAVRDAAGNPVSDSKGRLLTNYASPRSIAFDTRGLIWDVGVIWRPSPRTNLEAHVGRRYGEFGGYGTFSYKPNDRSAFNVIAYNNLASFGGQITSSLAGLPTQFNALSDALTGNVGACVSSSSSGNCLTGALATVRSSVFRSRGLAVTYNHGIGVFDYGIGGGYDRRRYIGAPGTVLGTLDGKVESYYWAEGYLTAQFDPQTSLTTTLDAYWFDTDVVGNGNFTAVRGTAVLQRRFTQHLSGTAAVGIDEINRKTIDQTWDASGSVGMRYTF